MEDQKPKQLTLPLAGQIELFDAVACLPDSASFPTWAVLAEFYSKKKKEIGYEEKGEAVFQLKFSAVDGATNSGTGSEGAVSHSNSGASQSTNVTLPASLKGHFSADGDSSATLASLPCPHCLRHISLSLYHCPPTSLMPSLPSSNSALTRSQQPPVGGGGRPSLLPTPIMAVPITQAPPITPPTAPPTVPSIVFCAFTGELHRELTDDEYSQRNETLRREQDEAKRRFAHAPPNSPQYTAQRLPVAETR